MDLVIIYILCKQLINQQKNIILYRKDNTISGGGGGGGGLETPTLSFHANRNSTHLASQYLAHLLLECLFKVYRYIVFHALEVITHYKIP